MASNCVHSGFTDWREHRYGVHLMLQDRDAMKLAIGFHHSQIDRSLDLGGEVNCIEAAIEAEEPGACRRADEI